MFLPLLPRRWGVGWNIALTGAVAVLVADLHVSRQREQSERQKEYRDSPLEPLEHGTRPIGIFALEPTPFDRQPVKANAAVELHGEQQHQIQRPPAAAPHSIRRLVGPD